MTRRPPRFLDGGNPRAGGVLVLVHAFPVGVWLFEPQLQAFDGWRVIAPALPGFDGSDLAERPSVDEYARHVLALLDGLGIERAVCGGVSMGGHIVFALLRQAPDRVAGIVLADTRSTPDTAEALEGRRKMLKSLEQAGSEAVADAMVPKLLGETTKERQPDLVGRVRAMILGQRADGIAAAIAALMSRPDSTPLLDRIDVPALVVAGAEDTLTPPGEMEAMAASIRGATFATIPGAGHLANLEQPEAFNAAMKGFLEFVN